MPSEGVALTGHAKTSKPSSDAEIGMQIVLKRENEPLAQTGQDERVMGVGESFRLWGRQKSNCSTRTAPKTVWYRRCRLNGCVEITTARGKFASKSSRPLPKRSRA